MNHMDVLFFFGLVFFCTLALVLEIRYQHRREREEKEAEHNRLMREVRRKR